jgi:hypothetical protein
VPYDHDSYAELAAARHAHCLRRKLSDGFGVGWAGEYEYPMRDSECDLLGEGRETEGGECEVLSPEAADFIAEYKV